jgi:hypothetical protein
MKTKERLNSERLVSVFNQDELSSIMTAMAGYMTTKKKQGRSTTIESMAFNKILDALLVSNYKNAEVMKYKEGTAGISYEKACEAMYESMY